MEESRILVRAVVVVELSDSLLLACLEVVAAMEVHLLNSNMVAQVTLPKVDLAAVVAA